MSSGPGILQRQILTSLQKHTSFVFQNRLLWEIAFQKDEIYKKEEIYRGIRAGFIRRSFLENFRRAVKSLHDSGTIKVKQKKLTSLNEAFDYFPYQTYDLHIHQLRKELLPTIKDYIIENRPRRFGPSAIEQKLISKIYETPKFSTAQKKWRSIEKKVISILQDGNIALFEEWLQCLVRGRFLFDNGSISHHKSLLKIYQTLLTQNKKSPIELKTLEKLKDLIGLVIDKTDWKIGELKSFYYKIANLNIYSRDFLDKDVKWYLREKHEALVTSLPGHKEPEPVRAIFRGKEGVMLPPGIVEYSPLLDKLITKQILRNFSLISSCSER